MDPGEGAGRREFREELGDRHGFQLRLTAQPAVQRMEE